jgi:CheY-like chemotaxis protein
METDATTVQLLLVDDEEEFRLTTGKALERRGFRVTGAGDGAEALKRIAERRPDVVLLDLKMPGMGGIETLQRLRERDATLPVVLLTGHGNLQDALAGIKLEIADFLQKPIDVDQLCERIHWLLRRDAETRSLREKSISELMVSHTLYPRLYVDQPVREVVDVLCDAFLRPRDEEARSLGLRSALVFDDNGVFLGLVRFSDLLKLVLPNHLGESPYASSFTGMFLAQCKLIGSRQLRELMGERISVALDAPLMEAVHLMVRRRLISLPVMSGARLVGVLRERDLILEIARNMELWA